ncbi:MAG TPA: prephenate dehydratase domain-containing protein [Kiritimatiellia bacterium]|nr:prephenate dehydratase domain-containing protein [Kiritimatiellia bacterium]HMO98715.1 prephenate dehydratase domain-containing protein [Kiritimatiellia bacterium]HMP97932.1 prephenate dehydratase domain-containing protein [Kiritimatiellia bacterium]
MTTPPAPRLVAYLGPRGTFSELVALKRFGRAIERMPIPGIYEVFEYVRKHRDAVGVVPIENSSGGTIYETIDCLVESRRPLVIREELSLQVRLALLGHRGQKIHTLYSHFAPMQHCDPWIRQHLPRVERKETASTAIAAELVSEHPNGAALGMRAAAKRYGLDILEFPVQPEVPNLTQFVCIGHRGPRLPGPGKTSLIVSLHNRPGSLCELLEVFRDYRINMTRILSRPIVGQPKSYIFFIDIEGAPETPPVSDALKKARRLTESLRDAGSYPVRRPYVS